MTPNDEEFYSSMIEGGLYPIEKWAEWEAIEGEDAYKVWNVVGGVRVYGPHLVDVNTVAKGWLTLRRLEQHGLFTHCGGKGTRLTAIDADRMFGSAAGLEYDRCIVDAVIQVGLFGEVKYGYGQAGPTVKTDRRATAAVFRALDRLHDMAYESEAVSLAQYKDLESFTERAKAMLGDRSELRGSTINNADWREVYEHYRNVSE